MSLIIQIIRGILSVQDDITERVGSQNIRMSSIKAGQSYIFAILVKSRHDWVDQAVMNRDLSENSSDAARQDKFQTEISRNMRGSDQSGYIELHISSF